MTVEPSGFSNFWLGVTVEPSGFSNFWLGVTVEPSGFSSFWVGSDGRTVRFADISNFSTVAPSDWESE